MALAYEMTPKGHEYVTCTGKNCCGIFIVSSQWTAELLLMVGYNNCKRQYMRGVYPGTFIKHIHTFMDSLFPSLIHTLPVCFLSPVFQGLEPERSQPLYHL